MISMSTSLPVSAAQKRGRYLMVGGFLGAGKTTAILRLAKLLSDAGKRVGLITNDQGSELVDTAMLRSHGFRTEEISGGCFCCRFNSLNEAAQKLEESTKPDVIIAEPVGSCTDLVSTVSYPLRRIYGNEFSIAPLSVLVDPIRAERVLGLVAGGGRFSEKVSYIYRKQLEEAEIIVINKTELRTSEQLEKLKRTLGEHFPQARVMAISARQNAGIQEWYEAIASCDQSLRPALSIDYDTYAEGEALLGWLNATLQISSRKDFDPNEVLLALARELVNSLKENHSEAEIAHLKMTLSSDEIFGEIAVLNMVRSDIGPEISQVMSDFISSANIILNLRAEASPGALYNSLNAALKKMAEAEKPLFIRVDHIEHFRPGRPVPTHRVVDMA